MHKQMGNSTCTRQSVERGVIKSVVRAIIVISCVMSVAMLSTCGGSQKSFPPLTITTASLPNGTSQLPYSQTITASGGVAPFTWALSAGTLPHNLALSGTPTNTVTISGTPDTPAQAVAFTLSVTDAANQSATQPYTVSILLEPDTLTLAPSNLSFGLLLVGTASGAQIVTLTNTGNSEVVITGTSIAGTDATDFSQNSTCVSSLAAGANCVISVTLRPTLPGPRSAALMITDNTVGSPHSVSLNGTGVDSGANATLSATSLNFGQQVIGTTSPAQSITLSNYGTGTLSITSITASANFGQTNTCVSALASGASCTINVTFTPNASGNLNGTISVTDDASGSPQIVSLSGTGIAGRCTPRGMQCPNQFGPCCPGLICQFRGIRSFCEPSSPGNTSRAISYWDPMNLNKLQ
jgi:hypothetical protein